MQSDLTTYETVGELSRFWRSVSLLAEVATMCRNSSSSTSNYLEALRLIRKIVPFDVATFYLYNLRTGKFDAQTSLGGRIELMDFVVTGKPDGRPAWSNPDQKPVVIREGSFTRDDGTDGDIQSLISAPLLAGDSVAGVLNVGCYRGGAFDENDIRLITVVSDLFAISTERRYHREWMSQKGKELLKAKRETQEALRHTESSEKLNAAAELAASIHHQINNPLAVIVGNVQCLLMDKSLSDEKVRKRLSVIEKSALKASKVNRNLLSINSLARQDDD